MNRQSSQTLASRLQRGVTLIESTIVMSVLATTVGLVLPGFQQAREMQHLRGSGAQLQIDVQYARSAAVALNQTVRLSFTSAAEATCYVVHTGAAGQCGCAADGTPVCEAGVQALRSARYGAEAPLQLTSNSRSISFDASQGTVTPTATMKVTGRSGVAIHHVVNVMGRMRSCTPGTSAMGYPRC